MLLVAFRQQLAKGAAEGVELGVVKTRCPQQTGHEGDGALDLQLHCDVVAHLIVNSRWCGTPKKKKTQNSQCRLFETNMLNPPVYYPLVMESQSVLLISFVE